MYQFTPIKNEKASRLTPSPGTSGGAAGGKRAVFQECAMLFRSLGYWKTLRALAEARLSLQDEWEYRRLLEIIWKLDRELVCRPWHRQIVIP